MNNQRFRRRDPIARLISCICGAQAKLIKRRNFPHGRKSVGRPYSLYKCQSCNKEDMLNKFQEVKR